ncbi:MAG: hypothetical protein KAV82_14410, partial [Phycisphaerae bacterium]|nr:hypothetical protein [Phycisphaerae bacterium]
ARIYEIEPDGNLSPITAPARAHITAGRGYWVTASQDTVYDGPLKIDNRSLRGISLAGGVLEHAIRTENLAADSGSVTISHLRSPSDPSQGSSSLSGSVPLVWFDYGQGAERDLVSQWRPLDGQTWSLRPAGKAGSAKVLRVAVNRAQLAGSAQTDGMVDRHHQAVLQVTDGTGFRRLLPVEAETDDRNGLWVGTVTINKVEWIHELGHAPLLTPTSSEFTFRIIIHKSDQDEYKLLTEATRLWQPDDEANTNGHYILVTPACQEEFANGKIFSPRVSTAAFSFDGDWPLVGDFDTGLTISEPIVVEKGHSLNPLQHSYHPDHECKRRCVGGAKAGNSCEFSTDCPADDAGSNGACAWVGGGCVEVVRDEITFRFDDDGYGCPEWGHSLLGGTYKEEITGLYRDLINVQGGFELRRISDIPTLCDAVNSNGVRGRVSALPIGITE